MIGRRMGVSVSGTCRLFRNSILLSAKLGQSSREIFAHAQNLGRGHSGLVVLIQHYARALTGQRARARAPIPHCMFCCVSFYNQY